MVMLCKSALPTEIETLEKRGFLFQNKIDGDRILLEVRDNKAILQNRRGINVSERYPEMSSIKAEDMILDGEIVVDGKDFYGGIAHRTHLQDKFEINKRAVEMPITFYAFDILRYNGVDLTNKPLVDRYAILKEKVPVSERIRVLGLETNGKDMWKEVLEQNKEGLVAKYRLSPYSWNRRSDLWKKIKNFKEVVLRFDGYSENPKGITLTDSINKYRCACLGNQSEMVSLIINKNGYVDVECQYLNREVSGRYRHISFRGVKNGYFNS